MEEVEAEVAMNLKLIDVRGQQSERRTWIRCFETSITAVLFCASLIDYDLTLREDKSTNRMMDTLNLFEEVCLLFKSTPIYLFLNKRDLFEEKIKTVDLKCCFSAYDGMLTVKCDR